MRCRSNRILGVVSATIDHFLPFRVVCVLVSFEKLWLEEEPSRAGHNFSRGCSGLPHGWEIASQDPCHTLWEMEQPSLRADLVSLGSQGTQKKQRESWRPHFTSK